MLAGHTAQEGDVLLRAPVAALRRRLSGSPVVVAHLCHTDAPEEVLERWAQAGDRHRAARTTHSSLLVRIAI